MTVGWSASAVRFASFEGWASPRGAAADGHVDRCGMGEHRAFAPVMVRPKRPGTVQGAAVLVVAGPLALRPRQSGGRGPDRT